MWKSVLLLSICVVFVQLVEQSPVDAARTDEEQKLYEQIYAADAPTLTPSATLERLTRLRAEQPMADLAELSKLSERKCNREELAKFKLLLTQCPAGANNLRNYVNFMKSKQSEMCEPLFAMQLEDAITTLDFDDRLHMNYLAAGFNVRQLSLGPNELSIYSQPDNLMVGLKKFLQQELGLDFARSVKQNPKGRQEFTALFEERIFEQCARIKRKLSPIVDVYQLFDLDNDLTIETDDYTLDWIRNARLCDLLLAQREDNLADLAYERLVAQPDPKLAKLLPLPPAHLGRLRQGIPL